MVRRLPWALTGLSILAQIAWILVPAGERAAITTVVVLLFTSASVAHAWTRFGGRWTAAFAAIATTYGLLIELLGSKTGWPFGYYYYAQTLQPDLFGCPVIVCMRWPSSERSSCPASMRSGISHLTVCWGMCPLLANRPCLSRLFSIDRVDPGRM